VEAAIIVSLPNGTWDRLLRVIQSEADAAGRVDWSVSFDFVVRCGRISNRHRQTCC